MSTTSTQTSHETESAVRTGPRVLFISSFLPASGTGQTMAPLARQMQSLRDIGVDVSNIQINGLPKLKYFQTILPLRRAARRVDIVHAHYGYCGWLGKTANKPLVISFMGDDVLGTPDEDGHVSWLSRYIVQSSRWVAKRANAVIVKSQEMATVIAPTPAHVVPNGVDIVKFAPRDSSEARRKLHWPNDRRYVLFPGDPDLPRKGFKFAKAAFDVAKTLVAENMELKILWKVEPVDVPVYMNACDAMVMTSHIEGSPNVVKEAMASDLPVISNPVGDVAELLDGVEGYHVVPREAEVFGKALANVLQHPVRGSGRAAIHRLGLDLENVALRIARIYDQVLEASR